MREAEALQEIANVSSSVALTALEALGDAERENHVKQEGSVGWVAYRVACVLVGVILVCGAFLGVAATVSVIGNL